MRIEGYEVLERLGGGAQGSVYRVRETRTGAERALKVLDGAGAEQAARFRRDAEALARLGGRGVVTVHTTGSTAGRLYFVMDLVPGGSLEARLRSKLGWREAVALAARIARTLERVAAAGLVHRDLKPANILLSDQGEPLLADFGCARDLDAKTLTETGAVIGTPAYMAPEQLDGRPALASADVYALGAILHEMLTGTPPFTGRTYVELWKRMRAGARPRARAASGCPRALDALLDRALALEPSKRPTAGELAAALERLEPEKGRGAAIAAGATLVLVTLTAGLVALAARSPDTVFRAPPAAPRKIQTDAATTRRIAEIRRDLQTKSLAGVKSALAATAALGSDCPTDLRESALTTGLSRLEGSIEDEAKRMAGRPDNATLDDMAALWTALTSVDSAVIPSESAARSAVLVANFCRTTVQDPEQRPSLTRFFVFAVEFEAAARLPLDVDLENRAWRSVARHLGGLGLDDARTLAARLERATGGPGAWSHFTEFELLVDTGNKNTPPGPALSELLETMRCIESRPVADLAELIEDLLGKHGTWLAPVATRLEIAGNLVRAYPTSRHAHFALARALAESGDVDKARDEFERSEQLEPDPDQAERHIVLGHWLLAAAWEGKDAARARRILEGPPAPGPRDKDPTIRLLVRLEIATGDYAAALTTLEKNRDRPRFAEWIARARRASGPEDWRKLAAEIP